MNSPFKLYVTDLFAFGAVQLSSVVHKAYSARRSYLFPQCESPRGDLSDADNVGDMPDSRQICALFSPSLLSAFHNGFYRHSSVGLNGCAKRDWPVEKHRERESLSQRDPRRARRADCEFAPFMVVFVPPPLFLNEHWLILLLTQAKAQVLYRLLSHWVGQWIKPLHVSTAAPRSSSARLRELQKVFGCQSITHMLTRSRLPRSLTSVRDKYLKMSSLGSWVLWACPLCSPRAIICFEVDVFLHPRHLFIYLFIQAPLDHSSDMALSDSGFEPGGKRNFLHITDKDGEQPQCASVSETNRKLVRNFWSLIRSH